MSKVFKPLKACGTEDHDLTLLDYPMLGSGKLDGIRCLIHEGMAKSLTFKRLPNLHIQGLPDGLDGELLTYNDDGHCERLSTVLGHVMRVEGAPRFIFNIFDDFTLESYGFQDRLDGLHNHGKPCVQVVQHFEVTSAAHAQELADAYFARGEEGLMLRRKDGLYKTGRSTFKEQILLKIKEFQDDEGTITGTIEQMHNGNVAEKDNFGRTKRSSAKAGKTPAGVLGALTLSWGGEDFELGTGFDATQRADLWNRRDEIIGQMVTFRYQNIGVHGRPVQPRFKTIRPAMDISS
jgi:DNA ligase-1